MCYTDKRRAIKRKFRIEESTLLFICFLGGCFGFFIGMFLFHHKNRKVKFKVLVPICIIIWSYIILNHII